MPQVTRESIQSSQKKTPAPYGAVTAEAVISFQERLSRRFSPQEFVTVMNVDDETLVWQYVPEHAEEVQITPDPMKITHRKEPEVWELAPGQQETIVGASAYLMIETLYKKLVAKNKMAEAPEVPGQARNFNYSDPGQQEAWIDKILVGKAVPSFTTQPTPKEDLGIEDVASTAARQLVTPEPKKKG